MGITNRNYVCIFCHVARRNGGECPKCGLGMRYWNKKIPKANDTSGWKKVELAFRYTKTSSEVYMENFGKRNRKISRGSGSRVGNQRRSKRIKAILEDMQKRARKRGATEEEICAKGMDLCRTLCPRERMWPVSFLFGKISRSR